MTDCTNYTVLVKGTERYVFIWEDRDLKALLQTMGRFAAGKELSFTWYDAMVLSQRARKQATKSGTAQLS